MYCVSCGAAVTAQFCTNCGAAAPNQQPVQVTYTPQIQPNQASYAPPVQPMYPLNASAPAQTSGMAIASLICAFFFPLLGLILGVVAKRDIRDSRGTKTGDGLATAGIAISAVFVVLGFFLILISLAAGSV